MKKLVIKKLESIYETLGSGIMWKLLRKKLKDLIENILHRIKPGGFES